MSERITYSGLSFDEHRALFPERWRKRVRDWSFFWWGLTIIPIFLLLNWLFGETWDRGDTNLCLGWIMARFWVALSPDQLTPKTTWFLDQPTAWQKFRAYLHARGTA